MVAGVAAIRSAYCFATNLSVHFPAKHASSQANEIAAPAATGARCTPTMWHLGAGSGVRKKFK